MTKRIRENLYKFCDFEGVPVVDLISELQQILREVPEGETLMIELRAIEDYGNYSIEQAYYYFRDQTEEEKQREQLKLKAQEEAQTQKERALFEALKAKFESN